MCLAYTHVVMLHSSFPLRCSLVLPEHDVFSDARRKSRLKIEGEGIDRGETCSRSDGRVNAIQDTEELRYWASAMTGTRSQSGAKSGKWLRGVVI